MKESRKQLYMDQAKRFAKESHCERLKVGCVIVKDDFVIAHGWNGMPAGMDNCCEEPNYVDSTGYVHKFPYDGVKTKSEVLHAEQNALMRLARSTESSVGASCFVTTAPCITCAVLLHQAGIKEVYYNNTYRDNSGIEFLKKVGVKIEQLQ